MFRKYSCEKKNTKNDITTSEVKKKKKKLLTIYKNDPEIVYDYVLNDIKKCKKRVLIWEISECS